MNLKSEFPTLMQGLDVDEVRNLLVIDENYDDVDSDEFDVFDPSEFNYMVYVTEVLQDVLGEERLLKAAAELSKSSDFQSFYVNDKDMYGLMTDLDEEEIAHSILTTMQGTLS